MRGILAHVVGLSYWLYLLHDLKECIHLEVFCRLNRSDFKSAIEAVMNRMQQQKRVTPTKVLQEMEIERVAAKSSVAGYLRGLIRKRAKKRKPKSNDHTVQADVVEVGEG